MPRKTISPSNVHFINNKKILTAFLLSNLALNSVSAVGYLDLHQNADYWVLPRNNQDWINYIYAKDDNDGTYWHDPHVNQYEYGGGANCIRITNAIGSGTEIWEGNDYSVSSTGRVYITHSLVTGNNLSAISFTDGTILSNDYEITVNSGVNIYNADSPTNATINLIQLIGSNRITIKNSGGIGNGSGVAITTASMGLGLTLDQYSGSTCTGTINCSLIGTNDINIYGGTIHSHINGGLLATNSNLNFYTNYTINDNIVPVTFSINNTHGHTLTIANEANINTTNVLNTSSTSTSNIEGGDVSAIINNSGTLNVSGGSVSGSNTVTNNSGSNINIYGSATVNAPIANSGTLNISGGSVSGSNTLTNSNQLNISGSGTVNVPISNSGTLNIRGGTVSGDNTLTNNGQVNVSGGTFDTPITNNSSHTISILSGGNISNVGGARTSATITNNGLIEISSGGSITIGTKSISLNGTGTINNSGSMTINTEGSVSGNTINTSGTLTCSAVGSAGCSSPINNSGTISIDKNFNISGNITNTSGTITSKGNLSGIITNRASLILNAGTVSGSNDITNSGTMTVNKGATISATGTIQNSGTLDLEGGVITTTINNQETGLFIVGGGSTLSGTTPFTNAGTLQAKVGGTISIPITFNPDTGGMVNLAGGYITGPITGSGSSKEIINILADGDSAQALSQVKNVGNIFVNANNFTINTVMKGVNYNFIAGYASNVTIGGGGDLSGNGSISNAGTLSISGGTIGADSAMGNVINSGVFNVAGDVKVRNFTNGINQPAAPPLLTSINTINIVVNSDGSPTGTFGPGSSDGINITPPIQKIDPNPLYTTPATVSGSAIPNIGSRLNISLTDAGAGTEDIVTLMANKGTINFSAGVDFTGITVRGLGSSVVYLKGPISSIKTCVDEHLQFIPTFSQYGVGTVTIAINNNATAGGGTRGIVNGSTNESLNSGTLNITANNMVTRHVTNTLGNINVSGGDLSGSISNAYNITNSPFASDSLHSDVNTNTITVSGSGTIGKNAIFKNIDNQGILIVKDAGATINATAIKLTNAQIPLSTSFYNSTSSGIMSTSGVINAPVNFNKNEILVIGGGSINGVVEFKGTGTNDTNIYVVGDFTSSNSISNINTIVVNTINNLKDSSNINYIANSDILDIFGSGVGNFTVKNPISGISNKFTTAIGTTVTINNTGSLAGNGIINNAGTLTIASPPKNTSATSGDVVIAAANSDVIGTLAVPMGVFTNTGAVNINANNAYVTSFINNNAQAILTVAGGSLKTGANGFRNTLGTVNISKGNISSLSDNNNTFTNDAGQTITISGTGVIGVANYTFNKVNNSGIINVKDNGLINAPIENGGQLNLYVPDGNLGNITNKLGTTPGIINVNTGGVLQDNNLAIAGGTINLNSGGIINKPIVFDTQESTLNLVGGTLNNNVYSSLATGSGVGIVNVKVDYTYDGAHSINNISQFNVKSGITTIKSAITNINGSATVEQGATMLVNNQGNISGTATALTNSGTITLNTGGTLSLPIVFGSDGGVLNLSGGYLTTSISGSGAVGSGKGTINLTSGTNYRDFDQHISNIDTINAQGTSFSIHAPITSINTAFNVVQSSDVTINTNGYLSGNGTINNSGIITLAGGTIGVSADKIRKINNSGTINVNNNIYVAGNIINNGGTNSAASAVGGDGIFDTTPAAGSTSAAQTATGIIVNDGGNIYGNVGSVLQNYGVVTLNKGGTINIPVDFGTVDSGILNLSGGTMNANIRGGDRISTSAGTVNVNVDNIYTGNGYSIDHVNNINVNNTSIFKIQSNILGVNNSFTIASGATAIIDINNVAPQASEISGKAVITNAGTLYVKNGNLGSSTQSFINLQNKGTLNVDATGSIYATLINHNGSMTTSGNIHAPILFGSNITQLNIGGGTISGIITGYTADPNAVGNANVINIIGDFSTSNNINDIAAIKVKHGTFNINNPIAGLSNNFSTIYSTTTNLNSSINGTGIINNIGTMNVLPGGSIGILGIGGAENTPFSNIYNAGIFNMNSSSKVIIDNIHNGSYAPNSGDSQSISGQFNTYGNININVTSLNLNIDLNNQSITGSLPGTQTTTENTSLTFSTTNKNAITLTGIDDNGGIIQLTAAHGRLSIPSANTANLASISGNNTDTVILAGSLNNLNNSLQGLVFTPDANYVGTDANIEIYLHNNQVISASGSSIITNVEQPPADYIPTFTVNGGILQTKILDNVSRFVINGGTDNLGDVTNHAANAVLNITGGLATATSVTNTRGTINISGGDLSGVINNPSTLTNAENQIINISNSGTIGANQSLGVVTNKGIINANGGNIIIGDFSNQNVAAQLNIAKGIVRTGNISNTLGTINISGGDLSSKNPASASTLTNAEGQTINIFDSGTIGANQSLGVVTNKGIINANGGNITIGNFSNQNVAAQLNIAKGIVRAGNISNTLGIINIFGGDLSSAGVSSSTLTNLSGQIITISGTGTIGANRALGMFNNNGLFNVRGGNISVAAINNNSIVNMMQPATMNNGDYILASTGTHIVNIDSSNVPSTLILANGTTTLHANATIDIKYNGDVLVPNNHAYNVIINSRAPNTPVVDVNNNITGINILGSTDLVYYTPHLNGHNIQVVSHRKLIEDIVDNVGNYPATPAATVLDDLINSGVATGDLRTALARLDGLGTDQEVSDAVNQLLPETSITSDIGFIAPSLTFSTITERAELIARSGIDNNQTGYAYGGTTINNSFWVKGFGGSIQQKQKVTTAGYTANTAGLAFGLDNQLFENIWVGLGFSTINTHVNSKDVSAKKTTVVTQQATLYSSYSPEKYYIDSLIAMAFNSYKLQRNIIYNNLNYRSQAAYNAIQPAAKIAAGYIYDVNPVFRIIPNLSLQYSLLRQSTYTEYGAGNLSLRDVTSPVLTQLEGGAGVKFSFLQEQDEQTYKPELHFMVLHDFKSTAQTTTAQFIGGGGTFAITGTQPNKTSYNAGLGFTAVHQDQFNFTLRYDFKYRNKFIGHSGYLAVRYMF